MNEEFDPVHAVRLNRTRLEIRFDEAKAAGNAWLVECRDLYDAFDSDGGVYFKPCPDQTAVDAIVRELTDDNPSARVLGIFDLNKPLQEQGVGLTRNDWVTGRGSK